MKVLLLGGPLDGLVVSDAQRQYRVPIVPPARVYEGPDELDFAPLRHHVYAGPLLRNPDRNPNLRALRYQGVR